MVESLHAYRVKAPLKKGLLSHITDLIPEHSDSSLTTDILCVKYDDFD